MSKKKSRRQRKMTTNASSSNKKVTTAKKPNDNAELETSTTAGTKVSQQDHVGLAYIRSDIRKTILLSGFIIVFYTLMYYLLQRTSLLQKATLLLGLGS